MNLAHAVDVDDRRTVHAHELPRVELLFEIVHRLSQEVGSRARRRGDVERGVIVGCFDPIDLVRFDDDRFAAGRHEKTGARGRAVSEELGEPFVHFTAMVGASALRGALERGGETTLFHWLEQVVEGMHIEGPKRIAIVRGHEDDGRNGFRSQKLEESKTVHLGHLDIEKHDVGTSSRYQRGPVDTGAFADHHHVVVSGEHRAQEIARQRLVIDDDDAERRCTAFAHVDSLQGIDSDAKTPPSALARSNFQPSP